MTGYHPLTFRPFFRMKGHINRTGSALLLMLLLLLPAALHGQLYLNEVMASNATTHADLDFGEYADWIEIYNAGSTGIDLSGWYLSDDPGNPTMWGFQSGTTIPAGGYLLVYADGTGYGLHTNFKLSKEGETVLLVTPQVILGDSFTFPGQLTDISFGRKGGDLSVLGYFDSPTPGSANGSSQYSGIAAPPSCSLESGFFSGPVSVSMTSSTPGAAIRYTLDGTEPTGGSALYTAPVQISATAVLRATSFYSGMLTAPPVTHSYFINEPQNLPVVSLVTDPDHFFSDQTGIYVIGTNGVPGYCTEVPHNVNQDWERPVNIELIEKDGTVGLNQVAGVKIFGGCSRVRYPIKSLALFARKEYETSSFDYPLFPDKPNDKYESFVLRAGADDQPFTMIRDALTANVVKDVIDMDVQANRPVVVYINGEYWGIHSLREKVNEAYIRDNYGIDPDSLELLSNNPEDPLNVLAGSADHYNAMIQYIRDNDISQPSHYDYIRTQMEMDEYINYQIIQIFLGGRDWPGNNIKFWRSPYGSHNRWRWILFDLDHMFKEYFSDIMEEATEVDCGCVWPNPPWSTYLFRRLLENEAFSNEFKRRFALYSTTWFSRERLHGIIDEMEAELLPELPRHIERWGGQKTDLPDNTWVSPIFTSVKQWQQNVQVIRDFVDSRHEVALRNVNDYFGIEGYAGLEVTVEPTGKGSVRSGDGLIPEIPYSGTFTLGTLLDLSCVATPGYLFSHWEVESFGTTDTSLITRGDTWNYLVTRGVPDSSWIRPEYDDSSWSAGQAELGYGDSDEQTVIDYGGDPANKIITTWFRKKLILDEPELNIRYTLHLLRDDGARIFVNGVEVVRDNLNRYYVGGYSLAEISQDAPDESTWFSYEINPCLFHAGENIIAVEVHQAAVTSSDLSFDLELVAYREGPSTGEILEEKELQWALTRDARIKAVLIADTNRVEGIYINEVMASNVTEAADEAGEYEDWIEFYNGGDQEVDLAGLLLSDAYPATDPWRFPADRPDATILLPNDYMVVFADGETDEGPLHASFKLSKEGEEVVLMQQMGTDTLIIDRLTFGAQARNRTYGRYPDGSVYLDFLSAPTPWASNLLTSEEQHSPLQPSGLHDGMLLYPVPTDGTLYLKINPDLVASMMGEGTATITISVYSITGMMVAQYRNEVSDLVRFSLAGQPKGLYLIRVDTGGDPFVGRVLLQ